MDQGQDTEPELKFFRKLPLELRDKIWKLCLPGPRTARIYHDPKDMAFIAMPEIETGVSPFWRAKAVAGPVPVLLHINKESRSIGMKYYKLMFSEQTLGRPIYFDVTQDTLCLTGDEALRAFYGRRMNPCRWNKKSELEFMHEVENLVRFLAIFTPLPYYNVASFNVVARFSCLEGLAIVDCGGREGHVLRKAGEKEANEKGMSYKFPEIEYLEPTVFRSKFLANSASQASA
jgi:2EXR family